jgi:cell wall-associated NlpC family hydrolase
LTQVLARAAIAPVFAESSLRSEQVTQLVLGETAEVLERAGEWHRVRTGLDRYEGWIHGGYVLEVTGADAARWREQAEGWSTGATLRVGAHLFRLPLRARVAFDGAAVRLPDGRCGEVAEGSVPRAAECTAAARAAAPERWALEHFAGAPYEWGGVTPWGVDCSGMVQTTFAARGTVLPRDAALQVEQGNPVPPHEARSGDLLFFRGDAGRAITHVAFAADRDTLIHSTVSCGGVLEEPWGPGTRAAHLRERLEAVRRLEER